METDPLLNTAEKTMAAVIIIMLVLLGGIIVAARLTSNTYNMFGVCNDASRIH